MPERTQEENPQDITIISDPCEMPPLPKGIALSPDQSVGACRWHDEYVAFSKQWSPRSFANFHEAAGWSMLSTIAKRRVVLDLGSPRYTPLFIATVATTSMSAKTEAAKVYLNVLRKAGLDWMLGPEAMTPQAMVGAMAKGSMEVPPNWDMLPLDEQNTFKRDLAYQAQWGWYYEEFGQHMDAMMQKSGGAMTEFRGIIRRMDDCYPSYKRLTVTHKNQYVEFPYLSLLACMTPGDLKPYAGIDSPLWRDGFFARFAFITPSEKERNRARFPEGNLYEAIPASLTEPLKRWHEKLRDRRIEINPIYNQKGEITAYKPEYGNFPEHQCKLGPGVYEAFYTYNDALLDIVEQQRFDQFAGNYARLHMVALRIAMLSASLENNGIVEMRHWAKGQEFAEKARSGLHAMYSVLAENSYAQERNRLEDEIIAYLKKSPTWLTSRQMRRKKFKNEAAETFDDLLESLARSGDILKQREGKTIYFTDKEGDRKPKETTKEAT
jgi:hypothetical protein